MVYSIDSLQTSTADSNEVFVSEIKKTLGVTDFVLEITGVES